MNTGATVLKTAQEAASTALVTLKEYGTNAASWCGRTVVWLVNNGLEYGQQALSLLSAHAKTILTLALPTLKKAAHWFHSPLGVFSISAIGAGVFAYAADTDESDKRKLYAFCGVGFAAVAGGVGTEAGVFPKKLVSSVKKGLSSITK